MDIQSQISEVEWGKFETAYGSAEKVGPQLRELVSNNKKKAMEASHELWCGLCHQHAYISSAAYPAAPILIEILRITSDEEIATEIMDILWGFTICTSPDRYKGNKSFFISEV